MSAPVIWHNPRCTKSRQTLALLEARGLSPVVRLYLTDPPTDPEIRAALRALDRPAIAMMRTKEPEFRALGLSKTDDDDFLITAMTKAPRLIERPIVLHKGRGAIGRPPETVLAIL